MYGYGYQHSKILNDGFTGILDAYGSATAAYSIRRLSSTYSGDALRVRRSSDSSELDIGFDVDGYLDTVALLAFISNDGYVVTWYDQSGNSKDVTCSVAASQPQIVATGALVTDNSLAAIDFDGTNDYMIGSAGDWDSDDVSGFMVLNNTGGTSTRVLDARGTGSGGTVQGWQIKTDDTAFDNGASAFLVMANLGTSNGVIRSVLFNQTDGKVYEDDSILGTGTSGVSLNINGGKVTTIGSNSNGQNTDFFDGKLQEIIIYPSYQLTDVSAINTLINDYYGVY